MAASTVSYILMEKTAFTLPLRRIVRDVLNLENTGKIRKASYGIASPGVMLGPGAMNAAIRANSGYLTG